MVAPFISPVIAFHSIRPNKGQDIYAFDPDVFEEIVLYINTKYGFSDLDTVSQHIQNETPPKRQFLISFDDGYRDNYEIVLPILEKYNIRGIFFILPQYIGKKNVWDRRAQVYLQHMNHHQLLDLSRRGHTIGSHGLTHNSFLKLSDKDLKKEFVQSKEMLEQLIGDKIEYFAYPYGDSNDHIGQIGRQFYSLLFSTNKNTSHDWRTSHYAQIPRFNLRADIDVLTIKSNIDL